MIPFAALGDVIEAMRDAHAELDRDGRWNRRTT